MPWQNGVMSLQVKHTFDGTAKERIYNKVEIGFGSKKTSKLGNLSICLFAYPYLANE